MSKDKNSDLDKDSQSDSIVGLEPTYQQTQDHEEKIRLERKVGEEWLLDATVNIDEKLDKSIEQIRITSISILTLLFLLLKFVDIDFVNGSHSLYLFVSLVSILSLVITFSIFNTNISYKSDLSLLETDIGRIEFGKLQNKRIKNRANNINKVKAVLYASFFIFLWFIYTADFKVEEAEKPQVTQNELNMLKSELTDLIQNYHDDIGFVSAHNVYLRSEPQIETNEVCVTSRGDKFKVIKNQDGWSRVQLLNNKHLGRKGWIKSEFIVML